MDVGKCNCNTTPRCISFASHISLTCHCVFPITELNLLRNVDANNSDSGTAAKSSSLLSGFRGSSSYNHETETIFALPRMQLDFKSIHVQDPEEPSLSGIATECTHTFYAIV